MSEDDRPIHPLFEAAMEQVEKKKMSPAYEKKLEKSWDRIEGLEKYLLPTDINLIFKPNMLRRVLYKRKTDG